MALITYADDLTFVQNLTLTWVKPQQVMLAHLLQALQERPSLCTSELARALPDGPHGAPEQSLHGRLKRLNRVLDYPRLEACARPRGTAPARRRSRAGRRRWP